MCLKSTFSVGSYSMGEIKRMIKDNLRWMYLLSSPLSAKIRCQMTESSCTIVLQIVAVALIRHSVGARGKRCLYVVCVSYCA